MTQSKIIENYINSYERKTKNINSDKKIHQNKKVLK